MMGFDPQIVMNGTKGVALFKIASKTPTELDFVVEQYEYYESAHEWKYFGSPLNAPRSLLEYDTE